MDDETKLNAFLLYFVVLTFFLFFKIDSVAAFMVNASLPTAIIVHILTNPAYLLVIVGLASWRRDRMMRAFLAGILIVLAFDIVGLPHLGTTCEASGTVALTNIDVIAALSAIKAGIPCGTFLLLYYLVLPFFMVYASVKLLGFRAFWNKIKGMSRF